MAPPLTRRVDLNIGYSCNIRCKFCYYQHTRDNSDGRRFKVKDLDTAQAKTLIRIARRWGMQEVDFTGGEPTIRPDLPDLVAFARAQGFRSVCVITNGLRLAQHSYANELVNAGVDDFLVSIHGPTAQPHDCVTEIPGSFQKTLQAIENLQQYPVKIRTNCVVSGINYRKVPETAHLFAKLGIKTANFILFNQVVEADWRSSSELNVAYSDSAPYLKQMIDQHADAIKKLTVRYIPFCLMQGYERFITNMPQLQYDPDEWDYLLRTRIRRGRTLTLVGLGMGIALHPAKMAALQRGGPRGLLLEGIKHFLRLKNRRQSSTCRRCAYRVICDGLWRRYAEWRGFNELAAVQGPVITDPTHFMQNNS